MVDIRDVEQIEKRYYNLVYKFDITTRDDEVFSLGFPKALLTNNNLFHDHLCKVDESGKVLLVNDFTFHLTKQAYELGITHITLCFVVNSDRDKNTIAGLIEVRKSENPKMFTDVNIVYLYVEKIAKEAHHRDGSVSTSYVNNYSFRTTQGDIASMNTHFDLIIANPPYAIGNEITRFIIDKVNFDNYINLMPTRCYKKDKLYQHIVFNSICHATSTTDFGGAFTTPICAMIAKEKTTDSDYDAFELNAIYDQRLEKFWKEQLQRTAPFTRHDYIVSCKNFKNISSKTSFSCGIYTPNIMLSNGPKTIKNKDSSFKENDRHYIWNFLKPEGTIDQYFDTTNNGTCINQTVTSFKTEQEADNFKAWAHSGELSGKGRLQGLFSILLRAMNKPTGCPFPYAIPRVDWSRPWTDEEILRDYGYTENEIDVILHFNDDLIKNNSKEETNEA